MQPITLSPSRQAEVERFAEENGQTPAEVVENALAAYIGGEVDDLQDLTEEDISDEDALAVEEALADLDAEGSMSLEEFEVYMRETYGLSR